MVFEVPFIPKHHSPSHLFLRQSSVSIHQQDESFSSQRAEPKSVPVEMSDAIQSSSKAAGGLSCERYGGPSDEFASEMVYWQDTNPSDASFVSPYQKTGPQEKYLTFELFAGWNNVRLERITLSFIYTTTMWPALAGPQPLFTPRLFFRFAWFWKPPLPWQLPWEERWYFLPFSKFTI